ncbi:MAG: type II CRISPR-associated endonuclease Cas1 [Arcobacteraceae bacterium]|nr:type II CRISPR-associated endonuclease Cas1 [Arcobacteraceae bacterium]
MGWKVIHLTKPCKIKVKNENLVLFFYESEDEVKVTLKDIDFILFDNTQFSITGKSIELLAKNNIATLFIDEEFHPSAILTPYHKHSTMTEVAHIQISITKEFKEKVWQDIIISKIQNQAKVLEFFKCDKYMELKIIASKVQQYDKNNDEAQSARIYWKYIFNNPRFRREQGAEDIDNSMLNYSYAILRASMARNISASGLLPIFGIWHNNRYNAFNLVDDLIEPFRPICDIYVNILRKRYLNKTFLDIQLKRELVALLSFSCVEFKNGTISLNKAVEQFVINYKKAMFADDNLLVIYPTINIDFFKNECI